jgi:ADP-ribose pyrophosphatase YjhB (NUDIX family)
MGRLPQRQRVAAYAVIIRSGEILLSRLAPRISGGELWTLPGGGLDHGEDPQAAVVREIFEETGLCATVSRDARVYSMHNARARFGKDKTDFHALRIVFEGWVAADAPAPEVQEALAEHQNAKHQRVAAYAVICRGGANGREVLLTRLSSIAHQPGAWTLPGGGIEHGERPAAALAREVSEECGVACETGALLDVHDVRLVGTAPNGRTQDYHGVHLLFAASVPAGATLRVVEEGGTTDQVAWVPVADVADGRVEVLDVVAHALALPGVS